MLKQMNRVRRILLNWPVTIHKRIINKKLDRLTRRIPLLNKLLWRLPQKMREKIFTDDYTVTERIIEKGFCFMQIGKYAPGIEKILDVGCCWSSLPIEMASLGFKVWGIDVNDYFLYHPNFTFVKGNICATPFSDNFFDLVTAISTIEHIGSKAYGDPKIADGDYKAVAEIHRILKPKGLFILTLPYGKKMATSYFRVCDDARLSSLVQNFQMLEVKYWINHKDLYWKVGSKEEAAKQGINERGRNTGNICLLLKKI